MPGCLRPQNLTADGKRRCRIARPQPGPFSLSLRFDVFEHRRRNASRPRAIKSLLKLAKIQPGASGPRLSYPVSLGFSREFSIASIRAKGLGAVLHAAQNHGRLVGYVPAWRHQEALDVLVRLADWVKFRSRLSEQQQQAVLETEFGRHE